MERSGLRGDERTGLIVAVTIHLLLVVALVIQVYIPRPAIATPERMTVNLASDISLEDTAPDPVEESRMATAPEFEEAQAPASTPETVPERPTPRVAETRDTSRPDRRDRRRPDQETRREPPVEQRAAREQRRGASRIGDNFLEGAGSSSETAETRTQAATFGRAERAALASAITRQLRPHWTAPSGVDADKLVSTISWRLNADGSLNGRPRLVSQSGITDSNRAQASLHAERAIRAVQLAAPFTLPEQFYDRWDDLEWTFDRRL